MRKILFSIMTFALLSSLGLITCIYANDLSVPCNAVNSDGHNKEGSHASETFTIVETSNYGIPKRSNYEISGIPSGAYVDIYRYIASCKCFLSDLYGEEVAKKVTNGSIVALSSNTKYYFKNPIDFVESRTIKLTPVS